jgi:hypothetical protein
MVLRLVLLVLSLRSHDRGHVEQEAAHRGLGRGPGHSVVLLLMLLMLLQAKHLHVLFRAVLAGTAATSTAALGVRFVHLHQASPAAVLRERLACDARYELTHLAPVHLIRPGHAVLVHSPHEICVLPK